MATPGTALFTVDDLSRVKVNVQVPEADVVGLEEGAAARVDVLDRTLDAAVDRIVPSGDPASRTFSVRLVLDNADGALKAGMFARVEVPVGEREAVMVPLASIIERGQLRGLFIVDANGVAHLRWVRLGAELGHEVEILAGVDSGETIVVTADEPLVEGDKVVR